MGADYMARGYIGHSVWLRHSPRPTICYVKCMVLSAEGF